MATHALFLRGINLGPTTQIAMADLCDLLTELGCDDVRTHLRSGNAVVAVPAGTTSAELTGQVEAAIDKHLGQKVDVVVRTRGELADVVAANPLPDATKEPARFLVSFLSGEPDTTQIDAVDATQFEPDAYRINGREIYLWHPNGVSKTKLTPAFWDKQKLGVAATARNWNTVTAVLRMLDE